MYTWCLQMGVVLTDGEHHLVSTTNRTLEMQEVH